MPGKPIMATRSLTAAAAFMIFPPLPTAAGQADPDRSVAGGGTFPAGWRVRTETNRQTGQPAPLENVKFTSMGDGLHTTVGPAAIYWRDRDTISGTYHVVAKLGQMKNPAHPEAFGILIGGKNLADSGQSYTYFLVRPIDGMYSIRPPSQLRGTPDGGRGMDGQRRRDQGGFQRPRDERAQHPGTGRQSEVHGKRQRGLHRRRREPRRERRGGLPGESQSRRSSGTARDSQTVTSGALRHHDADDERFSFTPFTRHPFFTQVNRWILERVICPGRQVIVDLGCGPGAVTELILERVRGQQPPPRVIGVDPSPSALEKARAAISSKFAEFVQGSAEWLSKLVKSPDTLDY